MAFLGPVVGKVIDKSVEFLPVVGPGLKYVKTAQKVTKFSNPIKATTYTAGMLLELCGGKYAKYSVLCAVWASSTAAGLANEATTDIYENVSIRGIKGDVYHCTETDVVIGIHTEGKFKGEIKKVQPISPEQLEKLKTSKSID